MKNADKRGQKILNFCGRGPPLWKVPYASVHPLQLPLFGITIPVKPNLLAADLTTLIRGPTPPAYFALMSNSSNGVTVEDEEAEGKRALYLLPFASCVFVRGNRRRELYELSLKCIVFSWCTSRYSSIVMKEFSICLRVTQPPSSRIAQKLCYTTRRGLAAQSNISFLHVT